MMPFLYIVGGQAVISEGVVQMRKLGDIPSVLCVMEATRCICANMKLLLLFVLCLQFC